MTTRDLFNSIMHYGEFDRMPVNHWTCWEETWERWYNEGLPRDADPHEYFNASRMWATVPVNLNLYPDFGEDTIEDTPEYRIYRDRSGVVMKDFKGKSSIPHWIDWTFKTADDWPEFKKRLQPHPNRLPKDLDSKIEEIEALGCPVCLDTASMMGWFRNWMGVQNLCYLCFDAPDVFADMVDTISELVCWSIDHIAPKLTTPADMGFGWEDICGKNGPLVSPDTFVKSVAPGYRKIRNKLEEYGTKILGIDSDGYVEPLIPHWLDAGVNLHLPIEKGTWNADPHELRKKFGRELLIFGGYDKFALEKGPVEIDAEISRRLPLMKEGGYIVLPDHLITPGVSLDNYKYYLEQIRNLRF